MKKIFVGNLASSVNENEITELFSAFGKVRSIKLALDVFTSQCKGFGFVEMEGHEARAAVSELNGKQFKGRSLRLNFDNPKGKNRRR